MYFEKVKVIIYENIKTKTDLKIHMIIVMIGELTMLQLEYKDAWVNKCKIN